MDNAKNIKIILAIIYILIISIFLWFFFKYFSIQDFTSFEIIKSGDLVSDLIVSNLIERIISKKDCENRMIFDGYPRNLIQAKSLNDVLKKNDQKIGSDGSNQHET